MSSGHGYTADQSLYILPYNLGATVAAGTGETWMLGPLLAGIPTAHLKGAYFTNGANLTANGTNYTTVSIQKGASTVMASYVLDTPTTDDLTADVSVAMVRSTTIANRKLAAADTVKIVKAETGTGLAVTAAASVLMFWRVGSEDLLDT